MTLLNYQETEIISVKRENFMPINKIVQPKMKTNCKIKIRKVINPTPYKKKYKDSATVFEIESLLIKKKKKIKRN